MRLAMVIQRFRPSFGGQGVQVESLCAALAQRGVRSTVFTAMPEKGAPEEERFDGYDVRRISTDLRGQWGHWPSFGARTYRALRAHHPDLVHVHGVTDGLYGSWLYCRRAQRPLVFEMALMGVDDPDAMDANPAALRWLRKRMYRGADAYVAMSRAFEPSYARAGLPAERFHVIPQGVDLARFTPADTATAARARHQLGLADVGLVVAFVGSLIERKGIDVLLRAWPEVRRSSPSAQLLLAGPGSPDEPAAAAAWAELSEADQDSVVMSGRVDAIEVASQAADVFAFPTRREGFGTVIVEAMAAGLPCVVAELPGITDFIYAHPAPGIDAVGAQTDGIVVPQDSPEVLARTLGGLLADTNLRSTIGAAARQRARWFDIGGIADAYVELYSQLGGQP